MGNGFRHHLRISVFTAVIEIMTLKQYNEQISVMNHLFEFPAKFLYVTVLTLVYDVS